MRRLLAAAPVLVGLACAEAAPAPEPTLPGRFDAHAIVWEERERRWWTYRPGAAAESPALVLALPGSGQSALQLRAHSGYRLDALAERDGFVVVYAEAWDEGGAVSFEWNDCRKNTPQPAHEENVDDVGFLMTVVERVSAEHAIDAARVYAVGVSDGGQMANRLASEHTGRFAAFASIIAQQAAPENSNCVEHGGPIPVLFMGGTDDPIIPWGGGVAGISWFPGANAGVVLSMDETVAHWRARNGTSGGGERAELSDRDPDDGSTMVRTIWSGTAPVVLYEGVGAGHTIPGGSLGDGLGWMVGTTNRDIDAMDEIWAFFREHERR